MKTRKEDSKKKQDKTPLHDEISALVAAHKRLLDAACREYDNSVFAIGSCMHGVHVSLGNIEIKVMQMLVDENRKRLEGAKNGNEKA